MIGQSAMQSYCAAQFATSTNSKNATNFGSPRGAHVTRECENAETEENILRSSSLSTERAILHKNFVCQGLSQW